MRQSLSKGGNITPCYGVLQKSDFDVYRSEDVCTIIIFVFILVNNK